MGRLIPAGSGFPMYRDIKTIKHGDEIAVEDLFVTNPLEASEEPTIEL